MTRPDYVPDDAEDITDHGISRDHNPNDPDASAAKEVLDAIRGAAEAAGANGAVYVPAGTYHFGHDGSGVNNLLMFGAREPVGISFYGDGPGNSTLALTEHLPDDQGQNGPRYTDDGDHGTIVFRSLTLDGNYENLGDLESNNVGSTAITLPYKSGSNVDELSVYNVRIRGWYFRGVRLRSWKWTIDRSSFEENAIGRVRDANDGVSHHISTRAEGVTCELKNSYLRDVSGAALNTTDADGVYVVRNCYVEGTGRRLVKPSSATRIEFRHVYCKPRTDFINDVGLSDGDGRHVIYNNITRDVEPEFVLDNCEFETSTRSLIYTRRGPISVSGDLVALKNANTDGRDDEAVLALSDGGYDFDIKRMSVHDTNGVGFNIDGGGGGSGTIDTLHRDRNDGLGNVDGTNINTDDDGGDSFEPDVPSRSDVGINTDGSTSEDDGGETSSPLFDDWTPRWSSSRDEWSIAQGSEFDGGYALAFDAGNDDRTRHALSCDVVGEPADVEVLDEFRVPAFPDDESLANHARVYLRSSGDGSENGYWLEIDSGNAFRLAKYTNGDLTTLARFGSPAEDTFYYRRVRAEGTELRAKVWPATELEPSGWDVAVTDGDHADGWIGLGSFDDARVETDAVSVATGGETARLPSVDSPPTVSWETPTDGATVSGSVTLQVAAGDSEDADDSLTVEYRVDGGSWRSASYSSDAGFYQDAWDTTAVADGTHGLEARATDAAGNTASAAVDVAVDNTIGVRTVDAVDVTDSAATLVGELTDLGGESEADVAFEWRETGGSWSLAGERTLSAVGEFSTDLSGLAADADHEFRAVVTAPESVDGGTLGFRTATGDGTNGAPVIDQFDVTDKSNPAWSRYYVDWTVSDEDDNLDTVVTELRYDGATVATESTTVSGGSAKFSHELRVRGDVDAVRLTVNDAENAVASETQSV